MKQDMYEQISRSPVFEELTSKRKSFGWRLSFIMLAVYYAYILGVAFSPESFGTPLAEGMTMTIGLPIGLFIIVLCFALTGVYVRRANSEFDALTRRIIEEASR